MKNKKLKLKGFRDILPEETAAWQRVESAVNDVFGRYGYQLVKLPLLEQTALFKRSIGETTDIVEKEMYTFEDRAREGSVGDLVTLRPEGTASAVRAYVENSFANQSIKARWFYSGPMFRRERHQKGRYRQFYQIGAECFGWSDPGADADLLAMLWNLFAELDLSDRVSLEINSLGCPSDRVAYVEELTTYLKPLAEKLCENCQRRIERNPLRVLDCKSRHCQEATADAPTLDKALCGECEEHYTEVRELLDDQGVTYTLNPRMVRGLAYYNRTAFELVTGDIGAQNAVAAGGRYDGLVKTLGGPEVPALGFAIGVDRLVMMLSEEAKEQPNPTVYFVYNGEGAFKAAMGLRAKMLAEGISADIDYHQRSLKAQFKNAGKSGARFAVTIAENEVADATATVKDLNEGEQSTLTHSEAISKILNTGS
jgi:histidyl-tRNA synthetase